MIGFHSRQYIVLEKAIIVQLVERRGDSRKSAEREERRNSNLAYSVDP